MGGLSMISMMNMDLKTSQLIFGITMEGSVLELAEEQRQ